MMYVKNIYALILEWRFFMNQSGLLPHLRTIKTGSMYNQTKVNCTSLNLIFIFEAELVLYKIIDVNLIKICKPKTNIVFEAK